MISPQQHNRMAAHKQLLANATMALSSDKKPELYCEKELRALGKSLECCVCMRLMESPARTRWYACFSFSHLLIFLKFFPYSYSAHYFCKTCILDCAKVNGLCPLCKAEVHRREVKPDALMTEMIELYKKIVVKVVKEEEEEQEEDGDERKKRRSVPYMSQMPMTQGV